LKYVTYFMFGKNEVSGSSIDVSLGSIVPTQ
jgi:hypothetical protein